MSWEGWLLSSAQRSSCQGGQSEAKVSLPLGVGTRTLVSCPKPVLSVSSDGAVGENRNPTVG